MGLLDSIKAQWDEWWMGGKLPDLVGPTILGPDSTSTSSASSKHVSSTPSLPEERQPWFTTRCGVCEREIDFYLNLSPSEFKPFDATVLTTQCEQCAARIAAVIPPVQIVDADTLTLRNVDLVHDGYPNENL